MDLKEGAKDLRAPTASDHVFKDECYHCFDTPFSPEGLYIGLNSYVGFCATHIDKSHDNIFLNIRNTKIIEEEPRDKVQRLSIESEQKERVSREYSICFKASPNERIPINKLDEPKLQEICDTIIAHISAEIQHQLETGVSAWDGGERKVSRVAENLIQVLCQSMYYKAQNGVQIEFDEPPLPYGGWKCAEEGCDLRENLWLNLSDGRICCGRYAPLSGVNGNGHAKMHAERTGFPLVVKLGTIENNDGDIYSYDEDEAVRDPWLAKHLAHFGLDINKLRKSEKSTLELELDANMNYEFSAIQEEGATLEKKYGPHFTGLINLGSSCYMNSALQMLLLVPNFEQCYNTSSFLDARDPLSTYEDFNCQLSKVVMALCDGKYSKEGTEEDGIRPTMFRRIAGKDHVEFSTAKQQDVEEYIRHLFDRIEANLPGAINPVDQFRFKLINRFEDVSGGVQYVKREDTILSVPVPMELAEEREVGGTKRKTLSLELCLERAFGDEQIDDYRSHVTGQVGGAVQRLGMGTFPQYLIVQIRRFTISETYQPKKLDVDIMIERDLDLTQYRTSGVLQPGEQALDADQQRREEEDNKVAQLVEFGFTAHQARYALGQNRWNPEEAANWLFGHEVPEEREVAPPTVPKQCFDGPGKYNLVGFISHMGSSPHSGHYVAHVRREGKWYIFNDEKVAISKNPPTSLGYLYLYERK